ncbi:MAG: metallophosphoesterase family protein [Candidatus Hodarchaeota archaeon]
MVKYGIISDTHITIKDEPNKINDLLDQLKRAFNDVDEIIHAGDICDGFFLEELQKIAPTRCVRGNLDNLNGVDKFISFSIGNYNVGVIHELPNDLEDFFKNNNLHILIYGHTHQPLIEGTPYNTLLINPGSPTKPKAPPQKKGFKKPIARPSVITINIDENNILSTFLINLKNK